MRNRKGIKRNLLGSEDSGSSEMSDDEKSFSDSGDEDTKHVNKKVKKPDSPPSVPRLGFFNEDDDLALEMRELRLNSAVNQQDRDNHSENANPPSSRSGSSLTLVSASILNSPRSNDGKSK